jgi:hypothetical protein
MSGKVPEIEVVESVKTLWAVRRTRYGARSPVHNTVKVT